MNRVFLGARSEQVNSHEAVTVLIDYEKYQKIRNLSMSSKLNETFSKVCADPMHEEYRQCTSKCVLGCRYVPSFAEVITSAEQCNGSICIEGCFCKNNLVRYQDKCIPATECPARNGKSMRSFAVDRNLGGFRPFANLPFFKPQGNCGPKGCGAIEIHNYNEAASG